MRINSSLFTPLAHAAIIIFFFFPFVTIKCNQLEVGKVKGAELATGMSIGNHSENAMSSLKQELDTLNTTYPQTEQAIQDQEQNFIERNNFASVALLLTVSGFILSFLMQWRREMMQGIIGLAGLMALLLMRIQLDSRLQHDNANGNKLIGDVSITYETGYWLALITFLLIAAINIYSYIEQMKNGKLEVRDGFPDG